MINSPSLVNALAIIADCYTPLLLLMAIRGVVRNWMAGNKSHVVLLGYAAFIVYGWMFIDKYFQLWARFGLDYSTHTAAASALVLLVIVNERRGYRLILAASLIGYGCMMYVLNYHTWRDMISTLCVIAMCLVPIGYIWRQKLMGIHAR